MRSEKDQMTGGREKSVVEIQFRDIPREQEGNTVNSKQKEEKKEVFTKVREQLLRYGALFMLCREQIWRRWDRFSTVDSDSRNTNACCVSMNVML